MVGKTISHYKVIEKIGQGGMGTVYRAEDTNLSREVAIKVVPDFLKEDPTAKKRFRREAKSAATSKRGSFIFLLLALLCSPTEVHELFAQGNVSFTANRDFGVGSGPRSVTVGDFNGDSIQDLATANANSSNVSSLLNDTGGIKLHSTVLVANFTNGNDGALNSRVYLFNPSQSAGDVTVRVFTLPLAGGLAQELTVEPLDLGTLGAKSALNVKLAEDILTPLGITTPYTTEHRKAQGDFTSDPA